MSGASLVWARGGDNRTDACPSGSRWAEQKGGTILGVRSCGVVRGSEVPPSDRGAHVCWGFTNRNDFRRGAVEFLRSGLAHGERLLFAADSSIEAMASDIADLGDIDRLLARGTLLLSPLGEAYDATAPLDWREQAATFERLIDESLADGFTGLRVAADATALVRQPATRRAFLEWELAADALMARKPMSGFCAFDSTVFGDLTMSQLGSVHGWRRVPERDPSFSLFFATDTMLQLVGEVDISNGELLTEAMRSAVAVHASRRVQLDLSRLTFVDVGGLRRLNRVSQDLRREGRTLSLVGWSPMVRQCVELLGFTDMISELAGGRT